MPITETTQELEARVEALLGAELTHMLRAATDALERLAPIEFEAIGARALDLDTLMINASAAAALPEVMARFRVAAGTRRAHEERYDGSDWAAIPDLPRRRREDNKGAMREIPEERLMTETKESLWAR